MNDSPHRDAGADFRLLSDLLERLEDQVFGRASSPLEEHEVQLLERMSDGQCSASERSSVVDLLLANREAMEYLACTLRGTEHSKRDGIDSETPRRTGTGVRQGLG